MKLSLNWLKRHLKINNTSNNYEFIENALINSSIEIESKKFINPIFRVKIEEIEIKQNLIVKICNVKISEFQRSLIGYNSCNIQVLTTADVIQNQWIYMAPLGTEIEEVTIAQRKIKNHDSYGMFITEEEINIPFPHEEISAYDDIVLTLSVPSNRSDLMNVMGIANEIMIYCKNNINSNNVELIKQKCNIKTNLNNSVEIKNNTNINFSYAHFKDFVLDCSIDILMKNIGEFNENRFITLKNFIKFDTGIPVFFVSSKYENLTIDYWKNINICIKSNEEIIYIIGVNELNIDNDCSDVIIIAPLVPKSYVLETYNKQEKLIHLSDVLVQTDDAKRFTLGINWEFFVINYIYQICNSLNCSSINYITNNPVFQRKKIQIPVDLFMKISGFCMSIEKMCTIFNNSNIETNVEKVKQSNSINDIYVINCLIPCYRHDLEIPEDLIEELLLRVNINNYKIDIIPLKINQNIKYEDNFSLAANYLVSQGLTEIYSIPFSHCGDLKINNPMNDNECYLRSNLKNCLQKKAQLMLSKNYYDCRLFEIGKIYYPDEKTVLGILFTGKTQGYWNKKQRNNEYFELKELINGLNNLLELDNYEIESLDYNDKFNLIKNAYYIELNIKSIKSQGFSHQINYYDNYHNINIKTNESWDKISKQITINHKLSDIFKSDDNQIIYTITLIGNLAEIEKNINNLKMLF